MIISGVIKVLFLYVKRISPVQLSDSGVYTCVARSRAGVAEITYDVQVQGTIITNHLMIILGCCIS